MLKTILNFKGVEVLSAIEQKNTVGGEPIICMIPWRQGTYNGPCIMLPPIQPAEPICRITIDGVVCE